MSTALNSSLIKALEILDLFSTDDVEISTKTVAVRLGMSTATAHRFLLTLEHTGFLVSPRRGQFTLGQKVEELGRLAYEISPLPALARPVVGAVSRALGESAMACRLGRNGPICIASANSTRPIRVSVDPGTELPMLVTAQGKLFASQMEPPKWRAHLEREYSNVAEHIQEFETEMLAIREQGYATNFGENETEIAAVAVPVFDHGGSILMTLSVFGILSRFDEAMVAKCKEELTLASEVLERQWRERAKDRLNLRVHTS